MKILGHVYIGINQQRDLADGGTFEMPLKQFRETVSWTARIGDLVWVKEPWCLLLPMAIARPGHFLTVAPALRAEFGTKKVTVEFHPTGHGLHRRESRFTFEVMGYTADAATVRFLVHQQQVDALLKMKRAA